MPISTQYAILSEDKETILLPKGVQQSVRTGYSAHADQRGLIEWVMAMSEKPRKIKLVHGDAGAREALYEAISDPQITQIFADL